MSPREKHYRKNCHLGRNVTGRKTREEMSYREKRYREKRVRENCVREKHLFPHRTLSLFNFHYRLSFYFWDLFLYLNSLALLDSLFQNLHHCMIGDMYVEVSSRSSFLHFTFTSNASNYHTWTSS